MKSVHQLVFAFLFAFVMGSNAFTAMNSKIKDDQIHLLLQADDAFLHRALQKSGGILKWKNDHFFSVSVPVASLDKFIQIAKPVQIEMECTPSFLLMDSARLHVLIDSVLLGTSPLVQDYRGRGVVVGIIDDGVDYRHPDFRQADSSTRFRYIWDQVLTGGQSPLPYQYGSEWNREEINNNLCAHVPLPAEKGHGTFITGAAAGNGLSVDSFSGTIRRYSSAAPESEIIFVRIKRDNQFTSRVVDAVDYIFKKADALGKPCVINLSVGSYGGGHDGKDLSAQMVDALLSERPGRALCTAAGNAGNIPYHLGYTISADSGYTFLAYNPNIAKVFFESWSDTSAFRQAEFLIGCHDSFGVRLSNTEYLRIPVHFQGVDGSTQTASVIRNLYFGNTYLGQISIQAMQVNGRYKIQFSILPTNPSYLWSLQTRGSGRLDIWSHPDLTSSSKILVNILDTIPILFPNYRKPDTLMTLCGFWAASQKVVTVGNFFSRSAYRDLNDSLVDLTLPPFESQSGYLVPSSGKGPTRDGRLKPDVIAPGSYVLSAGDSYYMNTLTSSADQQRIANSRYHILAEGSSVSSAVATGVIAQYFEKRPQASSQEVLELLQRTARKDSITGFSNNPVIGHGKLNAWAALIYSGFVYGCTDSTAINFNAIADMDTGGCVAKVFGCMDSTALNFNPAANVEDGSCILLGINNPVDQAEFYPNPATELIYFRTQYHSVEHISIYDLQGHLLVNEKTLSKNYFSVRHISPGYYVVVFHFSDGKVYRKKIIIE